MIPLAFSPRRREGGRKTESIMAAVMKREGENGERERGEEENVA